MRSRREKLRETLAIGDLVLRPDRDRAARVYTLLGEHYRLGRRTRYLNLGYWDQATDYDDACDALAEQLGLTVGMGPGDRVLDVGFGFGDQDDYWLRRFQPASITGLNITPLHVETARGRFPDPRLSFQLGSATDMPLAEGSVDRVTALECAFHFVHREDFFREALRVLRPGGTLGTADILPTPGTASRDGWFAKLTRAFWQIPDENWVQLRAYEAALRRVGFVDVASRSIRELVYTPVWRHAQELLRARDPLTREWSPVARIIAALPPETLDGLDYVLVSARKPG